MIPFNAESATCEVSIRCPLDLIFYKGKILQVSTVTATQNKDRLSPVYYGSARQSFGIKRDAYKGMSKLKPLQLFVNGE